MSNNQYVITTHSKSLFNLSQSQGWTAEENKILKLALIKFGFGNWSKIIQSGVLPGKNITQMNLQAQRMLGQQSLGGFNFLRIDPDRIRKENEERIKTLSKDCIKNGLIINNGKDNSKKKSRQMLIEENRKKYELTEEEAEKMVSEIELYKIKRAKRLQFQQFLEKYLKKHEADLEQENGLKILVNKFLMNFQNLTFH